MDHKIAVGTGSLPFRFPNCRIELGPARGCVQDPVNAPLYDVTLVCCRRHGSEIKHQAGVSGFLVLRCLDVRTGSAHEHIQEGETFNSKLQTGMQGLTFCKRPSI